MITNCFSVYALTNEKDYCAKSNLSFPHAVCGTNDVVWGDLHRHCFTMNENYKIAYDTEAIFSYNCLDRPWYDAATPNGAWSPVYPFFSGGEGISYSKNMTRGVLSGAHASACCSDSFSFTFNIIVLVVVVFMLFN